jgi:hypothetical protein
MPISLFSSPVATADPPQSPHATTPSSAHAHVDLDRLLHAVAEHHVAPEDISARDHKLSVSAAGLQDERSSVHNLQCYAQPPLRFHIFDLVQHQCLGLCDSESRETHEKLLHHGLSDDVLRSGGKRSFGLVRASACCLLELLNARVTHSRYGLDPERLVAVDVRTEKRCRAKPSSSKHAPHSQPTGPNHLQPRLLLVLELQADVVVDRSTLALDLDIRIDSASATEIVEVASPVQSPSSVLSFERRSVPTEMRVIVSDLAQLHDGTNIA